MVELSFKRKLTELNQIVRFPHLPCLQVGQKKDRYLPMEVCTIIPCQKRHLSEQQTANMIKSTARPAPERRRDIEYWVSYFSLPLILWANFGGANLLKTLDIGRFGTLCVELKGAVFTAWLVQHFVYNAIHAFSSLRYETLEITCECKISAQTNMSPKCIILIDTSSKNKLWKTVRVTFHSIWWRFLFEFW